MISVPKKELFTMLTYSMKGFSLLIVYNLGVNRAYQNHFFTKFAYFCISFTKYTYFIQSFYYNHVPYFLIFFFE